MQDHENAPLNPDESNIAVSDNETESVSDVGEPVTTVETEDDLPQEESRSRRFFRKFIRWTAGLLVVFSLGFLAAVFMIYNPKVDQLDQSKNDLDYAGTTIAELEAQISAQENEINDLNKEISTLNQEISALEASNQALAEKEDGYNLQIALLKARADVVSAQVELYEGNPAQARVLLESASQALDTIESLLPNDLKDVVAPLQNRLELAIGEIDSDPETAIADLGILAGDLLEIENALFKE